MPNNVSLNQTTQWTWN